MVDSLLHTRASTWSTAVYWNKCTSPKGPRWPSTMQQSTEEARKCNTAAGWHESSISTTTTSIVRILILIPDIYSPPDQQMWRWRWQRNPSTSEFTGLCCLKKNAVYTEQSSCLSLICFNFWMFIIQRLIQETHKLKFCFVDWNINIIKILNQSNFRKLTKATTIKFKFNFSP